eukprot:3358459-Alexandrium_andersonii.AAC.1
MCAKDCHAVVVQRHAAASVRDGGATVGNRELARLGAHGRRPGNVERDLHTYASKRVTSSALK